MILTNNEIVKYEFNDDNKILILFKDNFDTNILQRESIEIIQLNSKLCIKNCFCEQINSNKLCVIFYTIKIEGDINDLDLESNLFYKVSYNIDFYPIPLFVYLKSDKFQYKEVSCELKNINYTMKNIIFISSVGKKLSDYDDILFNFLDVLFLCFGAYPYIDSKNIFFNSNEIKLYRLQKRIFNKGGSLSHWKKLLANQFNIDEILLKYHNLKQANNLLVESLSFSMNNTGEAPLELYINILLQTIDGFMSTFYKNKCDHSLDKDKAKTINEMIDEFFPKQGVVLSEDEKQVLKNSVSNLSNPSFRSKLLSAMNFNSNTQLLFKQELENIKKGNNEFIAICQNFRNKYSHMTKMPKKNLKDWSKKELIVYKNKFELLLRILLLNELNIELKEKDLNSVLDYVNSVNTY